MKSNFRTTKMTSQEEKICLACLKNNPSARLCAGCRAFFFCDTECQKAAWTSHKLMCKQIKLTGSGNRRRFRELGNLLCKNVNDQSEMMRICSLIASESRKNAEETQWETLVEEEIQQTYESGTEEEKRKIREVFEQTVQK